MSTQKRNIRKNPTHNKSIKSKKSMKFKTIGKTSLQTNNS